MAEALPAAFNFESYSIPAFSYNAGEEDVTLKVDFKTNGRYIASEGRFILEFEVSGTDSKTESNILYAKCVAIFKFMPTLPLSEIPAYFYRNSLAIVFPYIRSFVSTLTLQANSGLIMLGLMNFSKFEHELVRNTLEEI